MKKSIYSISLLAIIACNSPAPKPTEQTNRYEQLAQSARLLGSWQNTFEGGTASESWEQQNDSSYTGKSFVVVGKDTVSSESLLLQQKGSDIWYIPTVKEQNNGQAVPFKLTSSSNNQLVFENPEHDFPKKISYTFISNDSLVAEISGDINGEKKAEQFPMKRVQ
ncbi:MAG: DUF6265 family protein [Bacteroidota bacterium]